MIKLNNKNITYVALADSSNSLKAPKEIWYADSNNSVKLVYRRKDALIEGEDYEKYHWLIIPYTQSDANSLPIKSNNFSYQYIIYSVGNIAGVWTANTKYTYYPNSTKCGIWGASEFTVIHSNSNLIPLATPFDVECNSNGITMNGELMPNYGSSPYFDRLAIYCYTSTGQYALSKITVDGSVRYVPCKLLKPVPKWLDANGIRRQVGECGMIDLVSGKFYGNVNSVGTFTVENYYERKEWLVGEIPIQTSMQSLPINSANFSFTAIFGQKANITILKGETHEYYVYDDNMQKIRVWGYNGIGNVYTADVLSNTMIVESTSAELLVNNITIPQYSYPIKYFTFYSSSNSPNDTTLRVSKIYVDGIERYIPCTLTMDLPASMDANNIARTKGTSGMWDLVSDKFYGNVANSGTFKAVNLAEGVDYEVHDKLIMHGTSGGYGANMKFAESPISLSEKIMRVNIGLNRVFIVCTSPHYYLAIYSYGSSGLFIVRQWATSDPNNAIFFQQTHIDGQELVVNFSTGKMQYGEYEGNIISNETYTVQASQIYYESPHNSKTVRNFKIDGVIDLIPVKLLKSIPSKYDGNGIARQVGECGMYDTVNDVFYGNVASSGSFTVSDDN